MVQVNMPRTGTLNPKTRGANGEGDTMENLEFSKLDTAGISPIKNFSKNLSWIKNLLAKKYFAHSEFSPTD